MLKDPSRLSQVRATETCTIPVNNIGYIHLNIFCYITLIVPLLIYIFSKIFIISSTVLKLTVSGSVVMRLWTCVMRLLQDEEVDIRDTMATLTHYFTTTHTGREFFSLVKFCINIAEIIWYSFVVHKHC